METDSTYTTTLQTPTQPQTPSSPISPNSPSSNQPSQKSLDIFVIRPQATLPKPQPNPAYNFGVRHDKLILHALMSSLT